MPGQADVGELAAAVVLDEVAGVLLECFELRLVDAGG